MLHFRVAVMEPSRGPRHGRRVGFWRSRAAYGAHLFGDMDSHDHGRGSRKEGKIAVRADEFPICGLLDVLELGQRRLGRTRADQPGADSNISNAGDALRTPLR